MQKYSNKYGTIIVMNKNCKNIVKLKYKYWKNIAIIIIQV